MVKSCRSIALFALCCVYLSRVAWAQGPLILREYQFLPQSSTLHVEGGFAYVDIDLEVSGNFGLATGIESHSTQLEPFAQFVFVDAVASDGLWELDLDWALNLTGLEGTFDPTQPRDLLFTGQEGQGQPMVVEARMRGRRLRLTGANRAGCCDMFDFTLDAMAMQFPILGSSYEQERSATGISHTPHAVPEPLTCWSIWLALVPCIVAARRCH